MSRPQLSLALLVASLLGAASARADIITLKDGRTVEGAIVERSSLALLVRQRLGEVRLELDQVAKITEQDDPWDQLQRLRGELGAGTADERYRLATFAAEHDFLEEAKRAWLSVLRVDPDHPGARAALGYVKLDGRWVTQADKARAEGLVDYRGRWVTPAEKAQLEDAARAEVEAKKAVKEAALAEARARREADKEEERRARRARIQAYDEELARARARADAEAESGSYGYVDNGIMSTYGGYWGYPYAPVGIVSPCWRGWCPPRPVPYCRPYVAPRSGFSGHYNGGNWGIRWHVGF